MGNGEVFAGTFGEIKKGDVVAMHIRKWNIDETANVTRYSSSRTPGVMRAKPGTTGWSGSLDYEHSADSVGGGDNPPNFQRNMVVGAVEFHVDDSGSNALTGNIVVENHSHIVDVETDAIVGGTITFVGDGVLARTGALVTDEQLSSS